MQTCFAPVVGCDTLAAQPNGRRGLDGAAMFYEIHTTEIIGGKSGGSVPIVSCDSKGDGIAKFKDTVRQYAEQMASPIIRFTGAHVEIYLFECKHMMDTGDVIGRATVKRPLHSPKPAVWIAFDDDMMKEIDVDDL